MNVMNVMNLKLHKVLVLCATAAAITVPQTLFAQTVLEEIVVTATKRTSSVQDIPIAVTAVTPSQLERQGVDDLAELGNVSASFNLQSSQSESQGTSIRIRGVGTTGNNIGLESAVGVFIDNVYVSRPGIALGDLTDLEGIEILRGPQGTLFGRNTTAGAVVVKTAKPNFEGVSGFINATASNFSGFSLQGGLNLPASDTLAFRVNAATRQRDGFLTSTIDDSDSHDRDRFLVRGQALWQPNENFSLRVIADVQETDEKCCAAATLSASPNLDDATRNELFPAIGFDDSVDGLRFNSSEFENSIDQKGFSAELNWEIGSTTLTYIGSYRDFLGDTRQDEFNGALQYSVNGITLPDGTPPAFDDVQTTTHELRLQGVALNGKLDWIVGLYYSDEDIEEVLTLGLGEDFSRVVSQANFGSPAVLGLVSAGGAFIASGGNPAAFSPISSVGSFASNQFTQEAESASIFTHLIYSVNDKLDLTLGLRYVDDEKRAAFNQLSASNPACLASLSLAGAVGADPAGTAAALGTFFGPGVAGLLTNPAVSGGGAFLNCFPFTAPALGFSFLPSEFDEVFEDDELIYTLQAGYKANDDVLLYGSFTHGYKAGGFNLDSTAAAGGASPSFDSEIIDSLEFGIKSTLNGGATRANLALFYSELEDFQVLEFTGTQFQTFNVDDVTSTGLELEVVHGFSDSLQGNFAYTYTDANYGSNCDRGGEITQAVGLCGADLTNAPNSVIVAGITYESQLANTGWGFLANVSARYEDDRRTSTRPSTTAAPVPFDVQDSSTKVNARIVFSNPNSNVDIELWAVNLTDEITRGITFNTPLQGASRSAFLNDPRTYGATVRYKF